MYILRLKRVFVGAAEVPSMCATAEVQTHLHITGFCPVTGKRSTSVHGDGESAPSHHSLVDSFP